MSDDPYRRLARVGLQALLEDVPPGPEWADLVSIQSAEMGPRPWVSGWAIGLMSVVVVLVVFGLVALFSGGGVPQTATTSPSLTAPAHTATVFVPPTRTVDGTTILDLTLLDGNRLTLAYPADLDLTSRGVEAAATGGVGAPNRTVVATYGTPDEFVAGITSDSNSGELVESLTGPDGGRVERWVFPNIPYIVFDFSPWTAYVWDTRTLVSENLRGWVDNLHGTTDPDGYLILTADPPLELLDAADSPGTDGPDIRLEGASGSLLVFINDCERMGDLDQEAYRQPGYAFCDEPTNTLFFVGGDAEVQRRVHESLEVNPHLVTTSTSVAAESPLPIPDVSKPRDLTTDLLRSTDWSFQEPGPLDARWPAVVEWTGSEIVIWGGEHVGGGGRFDDGAAFNPATNTWRMISPAPHSTGTESESVWTGEELVIWGTRQAMAWNPKTNQWRVIEQWPLIGGPYPQAVWTGEKIIDVNAGRTVDPITGANSLIADPPQLGSRASVVWTGSRIVVVTGEGTYDPVSDKWTEMPASGLTDLATAGTVVGGKVVAADYEMNAASYDPASNEWSQLPPVPLRFFECGPNLGTVAGVPFVEHCAGWAALTDTNRGWTPVAYPTPLQGWNLLGAGDELYAWGEGGFAHLTNREVLRSGGTPHRIAVGVAFLEPEQGWSLESSYLETRRGDGFSIQNVPLSLIGPEGDACSVLASHGSVPGMLGLFATDDAEVTSVHPFVGGDSYPALENPVGALDGLHHLTWLVSSSDMIDVACRDADSSWTLAPRIWTP
jgi:hypothetical protein